MMAATPETEIVAGIGNDYKYGFHDEENYVFKSERGLSAEVVAAISERKNEPRLDAEVPPQVARVLHGAPAAGVGRRPEPDRLRQHLLLHQADRGAGEHLGRPAPDIKNTWDRLGIPEAERNFLAGVGAQYESEVVYHKLQEKLESQGVIFKDMDSGLREHEELVKQYFGTIIPQNDNKFAALNSAVWSGGSFIYVPPGVSIEMPLQAYFRINAGEHGPVRAHADHRRRGRLRALRRGLHGADLLDRLAPFARSSRSSSRKAAAAATRRSRTGRPTSTTWSRSGPSPTRTRRWSGSTGTSARS